MEGVHIPDKNQFIQPHFDSHVAKTLDPPPSDACRNLAGGTDGYRTPRLAMPDPFISRNCMPRLWFEHRCGRNDQRRVADRFTHPYLRSRFSDGVHIRGNFERATDPGLPQDFVWARCIRKKYRNHTVSSYRSCELLVY